MVKNKKPYLQLDKNFKSKNDVKYILRNFNPQVLIKIKWKKK